MYDFHSKHSIDFILILNNNFQIFYKINNEKRQYCTLFYLQYISNDENCDHC